MRNLIATVLLLFATSALAGNNAGFEMGGNYSRFDPVVSQYNASGELFRIEGHCQSSCTLFLGARHSCVSPGAVFGFHAPWTGTPQGGYIDPRMTAVFARAYKPALRRLFIAHVRATAHMTPGPLMRLSGMQLASLGYRLCG